MVPQLTSSLYFGGHSASCWESIPTFQQPTTPRLMVKLNGLTRYLNSTFGYTSITSRMLGQPPPPGQVCVQQYLALGDHGHPFLFLTRVFIPKSKCPSKLLCWMMLTKLQQISRNCISTSTTKSPMPQAIQGPLSLLMPPDSSISSQRYCLARLMEHQNDVPLKKLDHLFLGPFLIMEKVSSQAF